MANLSNINGKFVVEQTTGYVGVGTTDPNYPIEVLNASAEIALNASGGSIYRLQSDSASNFIIRKEGVGDRLVINSAGNATFAGNVIVNGAQDALTINTTDTDGPYAVWKNTTNATLGFVGNANSLASAGNTNFAVRAQNDLIFASGGGTERMRIDSSGNVGINTDDPQTKLHSNGGSSDSDILWSIMTNNTSNAATTGFGSGIKFKNALFSNAIEQNKWAGIAGVAETSYSNTMAMVFYTPSNVATSAPQERMRITGGGNSFFNYSNGAIETYGSGVYGGKVVIKASGAEGLSLLNNSIGGSSQVAFNFTNEFVANQYNFIARIIAEPEQSWTSDAATRDARLSFFTSQNGSAGERMRIDSSGFVTIKNTPNTTGASLTLQNQTEISVNETVGYLNFSSTDTSTSSSGGVGGIGVYGEEAFNTSYTPTYMSFYTHERTNNDGTVRGNVTERMRIDSLGNVGIGTTSPTTALTIRKAISPTAYGEQASMIEFKSYYTGYDTETVKSAIYSGVSSQTTLQTTRGFMSFWTADYVSGGGQSLTEKMRIESNGNVGIGVTSPVAKLHVQGGFIGVTTGQKIGWIYNPGSDNNMYNYIRTADNSGVPASALEISGSNWTTGNVAGVKFTHVTGGEIMTIMTGGNVSVGDTAAQRKFNVIDPTDAWIRISTSNYASDWLIGTAGSSASFKIYSQSAAALRFNIDGIGRMGFNYGIESDTRHMFYSNNNTGAAAGVAKNVQVRSTQYAGTHIAFSGSAGASGTISYSGTTTNYNATSDYRLKENVIKMTGALDRVSQLKPSRFNFIGDEDMTVDGFLAHEVQEIVPEAITGEKDAIDKDGNPDYQGIDQSKLVPLLVAAIQELKADNDSLKARIETLENN